ncbi:unnamed protein product [Dibothriocephalus latus]|uniref:Uncharacterized protein n=1 Tax=Dibothriocephalus latus TaxID=60516 RepID=A0A3P7M5Q1_DIBLA|nr:unnamed protein product [Dibothriocephalus latus]
MSGTLEHSAKVVVALHTVHFLADNSAMVDRWCRHFRHLIFDDVYLSPTYAVSCYLPSEDEVADAIQRLRNNTASGEDGVPTETHKCSVNILASWLHEVIERVPIDWILEKALHSFDSVEFAPERQLTDLDKVEKIALLASSFGVLQSVLSQAD